MSKIHLKYNTLKKILDSKNKTSDRIQFTIRNTRIKKIIYDSYLLPNVINDIVYEYSHEITTYDCTIEIHNEDDEAILINLHCITKDKNKFSIEMKYYTDDEFLIYLLYIQSLSYLEPFNNYCYNTDGDYDFINVLNGFMKCMYNKINYIDDLMDVDEVRTYWNYSLKKNVLTVYENDKYNNYNKDKFEIMDCRQLTYFIVTVKCIIDGMKKYFKTHDIQRLFDEN